MSHADSPYRRDNWYGTEHSSPSDPDPDPESASDPDPESEPAHGVGERDEPAPTDRLEREQSGIEGTNYLEYVAQTILRQGATFHCPECDAERDLEVALSEPTEYVRKLHEAEGHTFYCHVERHRRRVCPACGALVFGGILADRPADQFLALVETVLAAVDLPPGRREQLRSDAAARKHRGTMSDLDIITDLLADLRDTRSV